MDEVEDINQNLFSAAWNGDYDQVSALISRGADPAWTNTSDSYSYGGWSALHNAAALGHVPVARLLLDNGWQLCCARMRRPELCLQRFQIRERKRIENMDDADMANAD